MKDSAHERFIELMAIVGVPECEECPWHEECHNNKDTEHFPNCEDFLFEKIMKG